MWQVADATGWSVKYIMEELNYQTLVLMLSDAPRYRSGKKKGAVSGSSAEEEAAAIAGIFRSRLTQREARRGMGIMGAMRMMGSMAEKPGDDIGIMGIMGGGTR